MKIRYVTCPIELCAERDPKGIYEKARKGAIDTLIGYNREYPPNNPDIVFDAEKYSADDLAALLVGIIREQTQS